MMAGHGPEGAPAAAGGAPQAVPSGRTGTADAGARVITFVPGGAAPQGTRMRQPSRVWYQDADGKLQVAFIKPGVADTSYTEILRSDLKEGQLVIIGLATSPTSAAVQGGPGMFMMGPRR